MDSGETMNETFYPPVWIRERMDHLQYRALSWPEKKKLLRRHGYAWGLKEACFACGRPIIEQEPLEGYLLDAWLNSEEGRAFLLSDEGRQWLAQFNRATRKSVVSDN